MKSRHIAFTQFLKKNKADVAILIGCTAVAAAVYIWGRHAEYHFFSSGANFAISEAFLIYAVAASIITGRRLRAKHSDKQSATKPSATDLLLMEVTSLVSDTAPKSVCIATPYGLNNALGLDYEPGNLEKIFVSIDNKTGAPIQTDDSYTLERRVMGRWYQVDQLEGYEENWSPLDIPKGQSEHICFTAFGRYMTLAHGYYRVVKRFDTQSGELILAGEFLLG
ncbi:MAG: immunoglobulin-like domain-containing protein [Oscillospiraceae bacterium]|nr:immunoglobulin-like domain-containing protein [Oscillospiraceae bacterium]